MHIECVIDSRNIVGESPIWSVDQQALWWIDVPGRTVSRWHPESSKCHSWSLPDIPGCMVLRKSGGILLALRSGIHFFDPGSGALKLVCNPEPNSPGNRFNEGGCDGRGRLWVGTMLNNFGDDGDIPIDRPTGSIYCVEPDLSWRAVDSGFWIPNTVAWNPDDSILYFGDSVTQQIYAYDFDLETGRAHNRRVFAHNADPGHLDGSAMDRDGYLWNTHWGAAKIVRYAPDGRVDREIELPVPQPASCTFGGPNLDTLYVTTARDGMSDEELARFPQSGSVFALEPGTAGLPDQMFGG